ncbi:hypothetical protein KJ762_12600 [bacterium]|nr:hypothetical protein [bacterium]MBU1635332.1 hypothetical protein [bacterium]MBU1873804.1 hypothetical protein [bacterium]
MRMLRRSDQEYYRRQFNDIKNTDKIVEYFPHKLPDNKQNDIDRYHFCKYLYKVPTEDSILRTFYLQNHIRHISPSTVESYLNQKISNHFKTNGSTSVGSHNPPPFVHLHALIYPNNIEIYENIGKNGSVFIYLPKIFIIDTVLFKIGFAQIRIAYDSQEDNICYYFINDSQSDELLMNINIVECPEFMVSNIISEPQKLLEQIEMTNFADYIQKPEHISDKEIEKKFNDELNKLIDENKQRYKHKYGFYKNLLFDACDLIYNTDLYKNCLKSEVFNKLIYKNDKVCKFTKNYMKEWLKKRELTASQIRKYLPFSEYQGRLKI